MHTFLSLSERNIHMLFAELNWDHWNCRQMLSPPSQLATPGLASKLLLFFFLCWHLAEVLFYLITLIIYIATLQSQGTE